MKICREKNSCKEFDLPQYKAYRVTVRSSLFIAEILGRLGKRLLRL